MQERSRRTQTALIRATTELVSAVRERLSGMPSAQRPKLVVFGESLGSFGGGKACALHAAPEVTE